MSFQNPPGGFGPPGGPPPYGGGPPPGGFGTPPPGGFGTPPPGGFGAPPPGAPPGGGFGPPGGGGPPYGPPGGPPPGPGYTPPPGYGEPAPGIAPPTGGPGGPKAHPLNIVSLVLGLVSVPGWFCCYLGFPLGIAAIVCGIIGIMAVNKDPMKNSGKGLAFGGIGAGALGFVLIIIYFVLVFALGVMAPLIKMP